MEEPQKQSCVAARWARTTGGSQAQWTEPTGELDDHNVAPTWRGKAEEGEVAGATAGYHSLNPCFYPRKEEVCCSECVTCWCPVWLQSWLPPVPSCCYVELPPDCGLSSISDLYETLPSYSWTTPGWDRTEKKICLWSKNKKCAGGSFKVLNKDLYLKRNSSYCTMRGLDDVTI